MKSMEPYHRKLGADTWFYAKRCFLGLALTLAKQMTTIRDSTIDEILEFFDHVDVHGKQIRASTEAEMHQNENSRSHTISFEVFGVFTLRIRTYD